MAEEVTPKVVQTPGPQYGDKVTRADKGKTPSAQSRFWATTGDYRADTDKAAPLKEQVKAFQDYVERPDVESRESILARENALPGTLHGKDVSVAADEEVTK